MSMSERTLVIDCQVLQTNAWDRGMGKYSLSMITALHGQKALPEQTQLLLNSNLPSDDAMLKALNKACPKASVVYLDLAVPTSRRKHAGTAAINKHIIGDYINGLPTASNVDFLILSLFLDQAFIVFPDNVRKLLLFYDLIPFLFEQRYAERINYDDYLARFSTIFEADLIYTISQTVADDLAVYLGIPKNRLHNINGAPVKRSHLAADKPEVDLPPKYILMNSGDELRKNNLNAVKGFAEFNEQHSREFGLVITSSFSEDTRQELEIYSDRLIFTGNVPEAQLKWLYQNAEFVFCPSEYEGLGLPVLEAMEIGKKVACSDIPVFREISTDAFYFFDQADYVSIADGLNKAMQGHDWDDKKKRYRSVLARYDWDRSAQDFSAGYAERFDQADQPATEKLKIAIFTPHPSGYSAIGKVVAESHAVLSQQFDIDYYFDYQSATHEHVRPDFLSHITSCYKASDFTAGNYRNYDAVIYHIGNSDYHLNIIKNALYLPGYAILHDTHLGGAFGELVRLKFITPERLELEELLNKQSSDSSSSYLSTLLNNQLGAVVHSKYALEAIKHTAGKLEAAVGNLPLETPELGRSAKPDPKTRINVGLAGILADVKGLPIIEDLAGDPNFGNCRFSVFGFSFIKPETLQRLERYENLDIYRDPSDFEFQTQLAKLDVLINYRTEYRGETSLTVLEAMRYGAVPIVRDTGWYSELPAEAVVQVSNADDLKSKLLRLQQDRAKLQDIGDKAKQYISQEHPHEQYLRTILALIHSGAETAALPNFTKAKLLRETKSRRQLKDRLDIQG